MLYVLRHARSEHNEWFIRRLYSPKLWLCKDSGIIDAEITETGRKQAESCFEKIKKTDFDLVICSPLTRTLQTMSIVLKGRDIKTIITPLVRERIDRLSDTGKPLQFLKEKYPNFEYLHFDQDWRTFFDKTGFVKESNMSIERRVKDFKSFLNTRKEQRILLVSHGNYIRFLTNSFLMIPNCSLVEKELSKIIRG